MKLKKLGNNETEIDFGHVQVFFSYETPVVMVIEDTPKTSVLVTREKFSSTTSKHINKYVKSLGVSDEVVEYVSQEILEDYRNHFFYADV